LAEKKGLNISWSTTKRRTTRGETSFGAGKTPGIEWNNRLGPEKTEPRASVGESENWEKKSKKRKQTTRARRTSKRGKLEPVHNDPFERLVPKKRARATNIACSGVVKKEILRKKGKE